MVDRYGTVNRDAPIDQLPTSSPRGAREGRDVPLAEHGLGHARA